MICLGQKAEDADDTNTYVDAWGLLDEACKLAGANVSSGTTISTLAIATNSSYSYTLVATRRL
jgi:hypothetical protein